MAAALATRGSTTDARNANVDMIGLPLFENGIGVSERGPSERSRCDESSRNGSSIGSRRKCRMHSSCERVATCSEMRFQSSRYRSTPSSRRRVSSSVQSRARELLVARPVSPRPTGATLSRVVEAAAESDRCTCSADEAFSSVGLAPVYIGHQILNSMITYGLAYLKQTPIKKSAYEREFRRIKGKRLKSGGGIDQQLKMVCRRRTERGWSSLVIHLVVDETPLFQKGMHSLIISKFIII